MDETRFGPVSFLRGKNSGKYPFCHSVYVEDAGLLVDPACGREQMEQLAATRPVSQVWLTHWHEDHIADLDLFESARLMVNRADAEPLGDLETFLDWYAMEEGPGRQDWRETMVGHFHYRPRTPDGFLEDGQVIDLGSTQVEVLHTPGHTPGHLSLFFHGPDLLFLGDYDLSAFGPWYGDRDSDIDQVRASVERLRRLPAKVWAACHEQGLWTEQPGRLWDDYLAVMDRREAALCELLQKPRTRQEIVEAWIVYRKAREPKAFFEFGEWAIMGKHLEQLLKQGRAVQKGDKYVMA